MALISTLSEAGRVNLAPMSSIFWLGQTAVLGLGARSQSALNLQGSGECVINLPSSDQVSEVDRIALTTGRDPVPPTKAEAGYRFEADKFGRAGLSSTPSVTVAPPRAAECPVQLEGRVVATQAMRRDLGAQAGGTLLFEVAITHVHVDGALRLPGFDHRIDPDKWKPLIMSFQQFYGLGARLHPSRLSSIDEEWYR